MPQPSENSTSSVSGGFALPELPARVSNAAGAARAATIPADLGTHELRLPRPPVDQRQVNCCVSCALGAAMEIISPGKPSLAPLFNYFITRFERGSADAEGNLDLASALVALTTRGLCRTDLHRVAFDELGVRTQPSESAFADGKTRALRMRGVQARFMKASGPSRAVWAREQLRQQRPVVIGLSLPQPYAQAMARSREFAWMDPEIARTSLGHCVLATGFNDARRAFHIRDSRGESAFDRGYWWLGYRVIDSESVQSVYSIVP